jgi:cell wall-associated NlpC family hydrolase
MKQTKMLEIAFILYAANACSTMAMRESALDGKRLEDPTCPSPTFSTNFGAAGGTIGQWSDSCLTSATGNLKSLADEQGYCTTASTWGPQPISFPSATVPTNCDPVKWSQTRVVAAGMQYVNNSAYNYCHHHVPNWMPPDTPYYRNYNICSSYGIEQFGRGWTGIDCTDFTSWIYNMAFGGIMNADTGAQACSPKDAPGIMLPWTRVQTEQFGSVLQPGDLLYICGDADVPTVTHGIVWTNVTANTSQIPELIRNMDPNQQASAQRMANQYLAGGKPIYIIMDAHANGPNLRPFVGWYQEAFSHARRMISVPGQVGAPQPIATYDGTACKNVIATQTLVPVPSSGSSVSTFTFASPTSAAYRLKPFMLL